MASYNSVNHQNHPYSDNAYNESSAGFITPAVAPKKRTSPWLKFGLPVAILLIAGAVVGAILGTRASRSSSSSTNGDSRSPEAVASAEASAKAAIGIFPTATNSKYMVPIYPTQSAAAFTTPKFNSADQNLAWPQDTFKPSNPSVTNVRPDRPRLIAPAYKWEALPGLIAKDSYLKRWNDTIIGNATQYYNRDPVTYFLDGPSGILDNSREIKMRVKAFAYAYRMTKDTKWVDRCWRELQPPSGKAGNFGQDPDRWNSEHFLDVAELSAAFGIAYDWLYDMWSDAQKAELRATVIQYGLNFGMTQLTTPAGWWKNPDINGNWNCVCNGGLTLAALAILGDDTTGTAERILGMTVDNAKTACVNGPSTDGTWSETADYWYFGTTAHAEMTAALITATGSDHGLLTTNSNFQKTGEYHMYAYGATSLFQWGDHGPPKFSSTANSMFLYSTQYKRPEYALFQRDRADAAEPWSMFWYDPTVSGAFWNGADLDKFFDDPNDQWASLRSSWSDFEGVFVAIKAGQNGNHQTHNDLDAGDFVLDAMGTRWAGEYGSSDYRATGYFNSPAQDSDRWKYYRKATIGQNTIAINRQNQRVDAAPKILAHESSETQQDANPGFVAPQDSTAFWVADLTSAYNDATSVHRGLRLLNGRKQVLIQDEITAAQPFEWRMQTNATLTLQGKQARLDLDGKAMDLEILSSDGSFTEGSVALIQSDPQPPVADTNQSPSRVLVIALPAGTHNIQVLFTPQWGNGFTPVKPASVDLASWSLTSHN